MKIIIVGCGKVGYSLAHGLSSEGNDLTVIDIDGEALRKAYDNLDVMCIKGNGLLSSTLINAGIRECDLLIAVTGGDEMNMVCCLTAKKLGAKHCVARIRDPEYADELSLLKDDIGLDMAINPEREAAGEIARIIKFPPAAGVEFFAGGRIEMVEIKVSPDLLLCKRQLKDIKGQFSESILIGAVQREEEVFIPGGEFIIQENDLIYIIGEHSRVQGYCKEIGVNFYRIKSAMILGGGRLSYYLAKSLLEMGVKVKVVEKSRERCDELSQFLSEALVICGDGTDEDLLDSENLKQMDAFIAVTGHDEDNLISALLAKENGVKKCIAKINRIDHINLLGGIGIDSLISPKLVTANHIIRFARGLKSALENPVTALYKLFDGKVEALEFTATSHAKLLDTPLKELNLGEGIIVAAILRNGKAIIPHGEDMIKQGDSVILMVKGRKFSDLNEILHAHRGSAGGGSV